MSNEKSLKQMNSGGLWLLLLFNVFIYVLIFFPEFVALFGNDVKSLLTFRASALVAAPIVLFVINGLLTSDQKAFLIYWKFKNTLPGHRAFTKYAQRDPRVNLDRLTQLHGSLPSEPKAQNSLWYKIYRSHKDDVIVRNSHKAFLLARDMCSQAFLFVLLSIVMLFASGVDQRWIYLLIVMIEYIVTVRLAQNHGRQFVRNVLAVDSTR